MNENEDMLVLEYRSAIIIQQLIEERDLANKRLARMKESIRVERAAFHTIAWIHKTCITGCPESFKGKCQLMRQARKRMEA